MAASPNVKDVLERWIQPEDKSVAEVLDIFALEQFLADLCRDTQRWVRRHQLQATGAALQLAEAFMAVEQETKPIKKEKGGILMLAS